MLSNKVYYFFTFIALTIYIWSILLCPRVVLQEGTEPTGQQVARVVTESPLDRMLLAGVYAAVALMNLHLPMFFLVAERPMQILPVGPFSLNALVLFPKLMYKVFTCNRLFIGSLWLLGSRDGYRTLLRVGVLSVMQLYTLGKIYFALYYTTEVRNRRPRGNRRPQRNAAAA